MIGKSLFLDMNNYEKEAIETALRWNEEGFNKRNKEITIEYLHFPHVRLWENKFSIFEDAEAFLKGYDIQTENLKKEGWDHTVTLDIKAVQSEEFSSFRESFKAYGAFSHRHLPEIEQTLMDIINTIQLLVIELKLELILC